MLAGLYTSQRGAHTYYLKAGSVAVRPDGLLNLIHYEVSELSPDLSVGCDECRAPPLDSSKPHMGSSSCEPHLSTVRVACVPRCPCLPGAGWRAYVCVGQSSEHTVIRASPALSSGSFLEPLELLTHC